MNFKNRHFTCVVSGSPQPSSPDFLPRGCYKEINMYMRTHRHIPFVISVNKSSSVMFGILKRVTLPCFRVLSEMFSLFLGGDVCMR